MEHITLIGMKSFSYNDGERIPTEIEDFDTFQDLLATRDLTMQEEEAERQKFLFSHYGAEPEPPKKPILLWQQGAGAEKLKDG